MKVLTILKQVPIVSCIPCSLQSFRMTVHNTTWCSPNIKTKISSDFLMTDPLIYYVYIYIKYQSSYCIHPETYFRLKWEYIYIIIRRWNSKCEDVIEITGCLKRRKDWKHGWIIMCKNIWVHFSQIWAWTSNCHTNKLFSGTKKIS